MKYLYLVAAVLAAAHAYTFARWLLKNGNRAGGYMAFLVAAGCIAVSVYRHFMTK